MSDDNNPAPIADPVSAPTNPAPTPDPVPVSDPVPVADPKPVDPPVVDAPKEYKLPDAYKDKPWASKIKSEEDLFKQLDNLQTAVGKKAAYPAADATPEQLDEYFAGLKPADKTAYNFGEDHPNPEMAAQYGDMLLAANISAHQANKLIPLFNEFEKRTVEEATSADGFKAEMETSFGKEYDGVVTKVVAEQKQHLSVDDQKLLETIPNKYLGVVYRLTNAMQKAYGAQESDTAHTEKGGAPTQVDVVKQRSELRQKITALESRQHTQAEKDALVAELDATYRNQK